MSELAVAAVKLATRGWSVFPLQPGGKRPHPRLAPHGFHDATAAKMRALHIWREQPAANIGMATGAASGIVVVDIDSDAGGEATMRDLMARHGSLGSPAWTATGSGWHALYARPGRHVPCSAGRVGPGVDVRGDGGYVVAPPSVHPAGAVYAWWADRSPGPMPAWLLALCDRPPPSPPTEPPRIVDGGKRLEGIAQVVERATPGGRNDALNWAAFTAAELVGAGEVDEAIVCDRLHAAAIACGLTADDGEASVLRTVDSGLRAGLRREVAAA
jgi:hypothetical protein